MTRDERLKAIQQAHDEFVESAGENIPDTGDGDGYEDANQFGLDLEGDQTAFVNKVEEADAPVDPQADFKAAIDGLQSILDMLKSKA